MSDSASSPLGEPEEKTGSLKFLPEGEIEPGIEFAYGYSCGIQEEPSITLNHPYKTITGQYILSGGVMTHKQVDELINFLTEQRKKWQK